MATKSDIFGLRSPDDAMSSARWTAQELTESFSSVMERPVPLHISDLQLASALEATARLSSPRLLLDSFAALLRHPYPPLPLLRMVKNYAKLHLVDWESSPIPWPVSRALYVLCIVCAYRRWGMLITTLSASHFQEGITWCAAQPWIADDLRNRAVECGSALANTLQQSDDPRRSDESGSDSDPRS